MTHFIPSENVKIGTILPTCGGNQGVVKITPYVGVFDFILFVVWFANGTGMTIETGLTEVVS